MTNKEVLTEQKRLCRSIITKRRVLVGLTRTMRHGRLVHAVRESGKLKVRQGLEYMRQIALTLGRGKYDKIGKETRGSLETSTRTDDKRGSQDQRQIQRAVLGRKLE